MLHQASTPRLERRHLARDECGRARRGDGTRLPARRHRRRRGVRRAAGDRGRRPRRIAGHGVGAAARSSPRATSTTTTRSTSRPTRSYGSRRRIPTGVVRRILDLAIRAFGVARCEGFARVDFFYDPETDVLRVNEINTIPGLTTRACSRRCGRRPVGPSTSRPAPARPRDRTSRAQGEARSGASGRARRRGQQSRLRRLRGGRSGRSVCA